ncbi:MAG: DUF5320 domain-containing protein [Spirochaetia bacterium]
MPRGDRTGPNGMGPMTGRQAGFCAGYSMPGYANPAGGRGMGLGLGRGRGFRNRFFSGTGIPFQPAMPRNPETDRQILNRQASLLKQELDAVNSQLAELEKEGSGE